MLIFCLPVECQLFQGCSTASDAHGWCGVLFLSLIPAASNMAWIATCTTSMAACMITCVIACGFSVFFLFFWIPPYWDFLVWVCLVGTVFLLVNLFWDFLMSAYLRFVIYFWHHVMLLTLMKIIPMAISMSFNTCVLACMWLSAFNNTYTCFYTIMVNTWQGIDCMSANTIEYSIIKVIFGYWILLTCLANVLQLHRYNILSIINNTT